MSASSTRNDERVQQTGDPDHHLVLVNSFGGSDLQSSGDANEIGDGIHFHLGDHLMPVNLDRALRASQVEANLLIEPAAEHSSGPGTTQPDSTRRLR